MTEGLVLGIDVAPSSPKLGLAELKMVADITQKLIMQGMYTSPALAVGKFQKRGAEKGGCKCETKN